MNKLFFFKRAFIELFVSVCSYCPLLILDTVPSYYLHIFKYELSFWDCFWCCWRSVEVWVRKPMHCIQTQPRRSDQKSPVYTLNLNAHISIIIYHPWIRRHPPDAEAHLCWKTRRRLGFLVKLFVKWIMKIRLNLCFLWSVAKTRHWDWATHWSVSCRRSAPQIVSTLPSAL